MRCKAEFCSECSKIKDKYYCFYLDKPTRVFEGDECLYDKDKDIDLDDMLILNELNK